MSDGLRVDKWLWFSRFCKSRSLAQTLCARGCVVINGIESRKSKTLVRVGDVVVITTGPVRRTVTVKALGVRRGPAPEAATLFEEQGPPERLDGAKREAPLYRAPGAGRPTKRERRALEKFFLQGATDR